MTQTAAPQASTMPLTTVCEFVMLHIQEIPKPPEEPCGDEAGAKTVCVRTPSGKRLSRRFRESDTLKVGRRIFAIEYITHIPRKRDLLRADESNCLSPQKLLSSEAPPPLAAQPTQG